MSIDLGDIHNDGRPELVATDMKPYAPEDPAVATQWAPLMAAMLPMVMLPGDIQTIRNMPGWRTMIQAYIITSAKPQVWTRRAGRRRRALVTLTWMAH